MKYRFSLALAVSISLGTLTTLPVTAQMISAGRPSGRGPCYPGCGGNGRPPVAQARRQNNALWRSSQADIAKLQRAPYMITDPAQLGFVLNPRDHEVEVSRLVLSIFSGRQLVYSSPPETVSKPQRLSPEQPAREGRISGTLFRLDATSAAAARPFFRPGNTVVVEADLGPDPGRVDSFFLRFFSSQ